MRWWIPRLRLSRQEERHGKGKADRKEVQKEKEKVEIMNSMSAAITNSVNETLVVSTKADAKRKPVLINPMDWWEEEDESSR